MKNIGVILASVREKRAGEKIASWFMEEAGKLNYGINLALIDLKEVDLPSMNEPVSPKAGKDYIFEHTRKWSRTVQGFDGFIILTPEYNHGYPGSLKNALDYLYEEWIGKPVGLVGYGGSGAPYSRKYLKDVFDVIKLVPLEEEISIIKIWKAFDEDGKPKSEFIEGSIEKLLEQMAGFWNMQSNAEN
jgi:NAD(P)H-dependent FMN reductase